MTAPYRPSDASATGTIVFDLDGVIYLGSSPIEGAAATITTLTESGWQLLYATNNSTKTPDSVAKALRDFVGVEVDPRSIVTSGMAAASYLVLNGLQSAYVIGSLELVDTLRRDGIAVTDSESADAVVVGFDRFLTQDKIETASRAVGQGAVFVATNTDATFPTPRGDVPGTGVIVAAIVEASGRTHVTCGKPEQPMYELIKQRALSDRIIMVGDRPETDVAFALASGWESVLTLSGVTPSPRDVPEQFTPDRIVSSIADIDGILALGTR